MEEKWHSAAVPPLPGQRVLCRYIAYCVMEYTEEGEFEDTPGGTAEFLTLEAWTPCAKQSITETGEET